ncbi:MAG: signal peptidase I [Candidatus Omnitrophica bacterium]|nr:signal peptidase I [Candidatus Omnitrophota bacterium]MDD5236713.1 signal peptidase I [Candidatus Omnitrophota bacterium]MDD5610974.1 signal peptidase I [Candidatus Omnitrophota bacterium]
MDKLKKKSAFRDWVESILIALILALFIRTFIVQAFKIPTGSMRMTLIEGDRILVNKFIYGAKVPFTDWRLPRVASIKRGDVIVFIAPEDTKKDFIKRVVGLPGDKVLIKDMSIYINGKPLKDAAFLGRSYYNRGDYGMENKVVTVPNDTYYVLGDNSFSSRDSRYWGFVPKKYVLGKAFLIYWPLTRMRIVK